MKIPENLSNHFLIAMPSLQDSFFSKSVIYLSEHSPSYAMGFIINKPLEINLKNLLDPLNIKIENEAIAHFPVFAGGPISTEQGFVIYQPIKTEIDSTEKIIISTSKETLHDISHDNGPDNFIVTLGYSGWEKKQLENEIKRNDWLVAPLNINIIFSIPSEKRWEKAAELIGIDINRLSGHFGHA